MGVDSVIFLLIASKESKTHETWGDLKIKSEMGSGEIVCGAGGREGKRRDRQLSLEVHSCCLSTGAGYKLVTSLGYLYIARPSLKNLERKPDKNRL